jgi:hypothetical protein
VCILFHFLIAPLKGTFQCGADIYGWLSLDSPTIFTWGVLTMLAASMATAMSWSHICRRMSGQLDVDDVDEN